MRASRSRSTAWPKCCRLTRRGSRTATAPSQGPASSCRSELPTSANRCRGSRCSRLPSRAHQTALRHTDTHAWSRRHRCCRRFSSPAFPKLPPPGCGSLGLEEWPQTAHDGLLGRHATRHPTPILLGCRSLPAQACSARSGFTHDGHVPRGDLSRPGGSACTWRSCPR